MAINLWLLGRRIARLTELGFMTPPEVWLTVCKGGLPNLADCSGLHNEASATKQVTGPDIQTGILMEQYEPRQWSVDRLASVSFPHKPALQRKNRRHQKIRTSIQAPVLVYITVATDTTVSSKLFTRVWHYIFVQNL